MTDSTVIEPMEVCFISDEYSQDIEAALKFSVAAGLRRVELRSLWGRNILNLDDSEITRLKVLLDKYGIGVAGLNTFIFKGDYGDVAVRAGAAQTAHRAALTAGRLGADFIRVFAFWREGAPDVGTIASEVDTVATLAAAQGVRILVENGTFSSVGQGSDLARLLQTLGRSDVSALWDPANVLNGRWAEPIDTGARALAGRIAHVHVKTPHRQPDGTLRYGPLLGGEIGWPGHLRLLEELGYHGMLSLETHWRSGRALAGRVALDFPEGEAFSQGGEEPTANMAADLQSLLARNAAGAVDASRRPERS